jgi:4-amino-4-deoxy-L-arabinose transferase-like glycosyltransferase
MTKKEPAEDDDKGMGRILKHPFFFLALACATLFYIPLGIRSLWGGQEARFAEIAREMLELHNGIVPSLNYAPYLDNSPFMLWLTSLSMGILGVQPFAARLFCATFGLLTVWLTFRWGSRWKNDRVGLLAGGILATSAGFFIFTQYLTLDMALTFWTTLTLMSGSGLLVERSSHRIRKLAYGFVLGLAGCVLTQGFSVPFLAIISVLVIQMSQGRRMARIKVPWKGAFLVAVILTVPWFILVSLQEPSFLYHFFIREPFQRYFTDLYGRPFYFYGLILLIGFLPWTVFLPKVLHTWFAHRQAALQRDPEGAVMVAWICFVVIFFSLSDSKLSGSLLPIFPALALLLAHAFDEALELEEGEDGRIPGVFMPGWVGGGVAALIALMFLFLIFLKQPPAALYYGNVSWKIIFDQSDMVAMILGLGVFVLVGVWGMRQTLACIGGVMLLQVVLLSSAASLAPELDAYQSTRLIAERFKTKAGSGDPIVIFGSASSEKFQALPFYLERQIPFLEPDVEGLQAMLAQPPGLWAVTDPAHISALRQSGPADTFQIVDQHGDFVLVKKGR